MNDIFSDLLDVCIMIYLDDILIYSNNMSKHHQHMKEVLKYLHKADLYAKAEKYEFHSESVEYLGYILSPSGLTISNKKVKIIQDWPESKKSQGYSILLRFHKLLLLVHLQLLKHCHSIDISHLEGHSLEIQLSQEGIYLCFYPYSLDSQCLTHHENWCFRLHSYYNPIHC